MPDLSKYRKTVTAAIGLALVLLAQYAPGQWQPQIQAVLSVATAVGIYAVPNAAAE